MAAPAQQKTHNYPAGAFGKNYPPAERDTEVRIPEIRHSKTN